MKLKGRSHSSFLLLLFSTSPVIINVVVSQKIAFADHYDQVSKDKQWPNNKDPYNSNSRNAGDSRTLGNYPYNYTSKEKYEENIRDHPDPGINWLSPNPFAPVETPKNNSNNYNNPQQGQGGGGGRGFPSSSFSSTPHPWENLNRPQSPNNNRTPSGSYPYDRYYNGSLNTAGNQFRGQQQNDQQIRGNYDPNSGKYFDQYGREIVGGPFQQPNSFNNNVNSNTVPVDPLGIARQGGTGNRDYPSGGTTPSGRNINPFLQSNQNQQQVNPYNKDGRRDPYQYPDVGPKSNYPSNYPGSSSSGSGGSQPDWRSNSNPNYPPGSGSPSSRYPGAGENSYGASNFGNPSYTGGPGQNIPGSQYDSSGRRNIPPPPPFGNYPGRGNFDPGYPNVNVWNEYWTTTTYRPTAPGVLGRWRPELQGQQRPEDINQVPQIVYVMTNYGRIQGFKTKLYDGPPVPLPARPGIANVDKVKAVVSSFVGIPYARAPINEGRFRPPRSHPGWQLHQAIEIPPACPQPARFFGQSSGIIQVDEDCLFLNVYSPDVGSGVEGAPFPVIFYIHDGDFIHGASTQFPPHQLVGWYKVVVVTVNFRLGSLGFLSTADEYSPGNYGMLDLAMALTWVSENIRSFNGDPERITLVGLGSGAAAAGLLMLSPKTKAMVKNVVAMEGAPTADWAAIVDQYRAQNTTQLYSFKLGCWQDFETTSWKMVQCLRSRSWKELANFELDPDVGTFPWSPVVDKTFRVPKDDYVNNWKEEDWRFLPDTPYNLLRTSDYPFIKYMTGYSRQCAADLLFANKTIAPNYVVTREWFDEQIHLWVKKYNYTLNPEGVFSAIRYAYTYWPDPLNTTHLREEYIDFLSDALYRSPVDETVKLLLARGIQVHSYLLNYTLEALRLPFWREVPRGMEYYLLSGAPFMDPEFYPERVRVDRSAWTEGDRNMSNFFMTSVANMAYYGQPTPSQVLGLYWERANPADLKYLALNGTDNSTIQRNYRQRELTFWSEYMPAVVGRYVPTYPPTTEYWWEPNEPLQIAFWTVSGICLVLIVALIACCLLWRTAKKQRDRIYDDLGLGSEPLRMGSMTGDEMSEYAETVKTVDSMDSRKYGGGGGLSRHPDPMQIQRLNITTYSEPPTRPLGSHQHPLRDPKDRFPTPIKRAHDRGGRETPQTTV